MSGSIAPLRIAILGVGKIGSAFAFNLVKTGGHDVTVIARAGSTRLRQLVRDGAILDVKGERADVRVCSALDGQTPYDLLLVTLLAHQAEALLPTLERSAAKDVHLMFNTFAPERLQDALGIERCCFGMPFIQATLDVDGRLEAKIGAAGQKTISSRRRWVDVFNGAGLPSALEVDMPLWLRCHVPLCVAFEAVSIAGERRGGGASWSEAHTLARGVHACFDLLVTLGSPVHPRSKRRLAACPTWTVAAMLWSMSRVRSFRELLATGEDECGALVDAMTAAASSAGAVASVHAIRAMKPERAPAR